MKLTAIILCLFMTTTVFAQDQTVKDLQSGATQTISKDPNDTSHKLWHVGGIFSLNMSQGSLSNWAAGGDNFQLALATYLNGHAFYKKGRNSWANTLDVNLGYSKTTSTGARKNDDRVDVLSKYGYALNPKLDLSGLFNFHSQFFKGYAYPTDSTKIRSSNFLAPAYVLISPGLNWHPLKGFSIFFSPISVRWIIVNDDSLASVGSYGVDSGKTIKTEVGAFASISYATSLNKIISYTGRLDLFSDYGNNPQNIALNMTNLFVVKLSKILSATYSLNLIYDDQVRQFGPNHTSPGLQLQSQIGVGILVKM